MPLKPWMKWYPADWRSDPKLRMCGLAARGLWADMLALMHEATPYGHLLVNAVAPSSKQLALLVGATERDCRGLVGELRDAGVFSETNEGVIYSRRMVRDEIKATQDRENGKGGGNPRLTERDNAGVNPPDKAQKLEARDQKLESQSAQARADAFDRFWKVYPHRGTASDPRKPAAEKFDRALKAGVDPEAIIRGAEGYAKAQIGKDPQYNKQAATWIHQAGWEQYANPSPSPTPVPPLSEDEIRIARLERFIASPTPAEPEGRWYGHHGPKPDSLDAARAEIARLRTGPDRSAA